jgi:uncharacterized protein YoxC
MSKKKEKGTKVKKKKSEIPSNTEHPMPIETKHTTLVYDDHVSAEEVMELVNSLSHDIEQLEKSNQSLQQQVALSQKKPQPLYPLLMLITLILGVGIITVGFYGSRISAHISENLSTVANRIDNVRTQVDTMNTSMGSLSTDLEQFNVSMNTLSANIATVDENVTKVASDVNKIDSGTTSTSYDTRYVPRPVNPWAPWR